MDNQDVKVTKNGLKYDGLSVNWHTIAKLNPGFDISGDAVNNFFDYMASNAVNLDVKPKKYSTPIITII